MFDRVQAILFVSNLSGFYEPIWGQEGTNRLQEDLYLFEQICNMPFFQRANLFLFLILNTAEDFHSRAKYLSHLQSQQCSRIGR
jgi:hypothetical protein